MLYLQKNRILEENFNMCVGHIVRFRINSPIKNYLKNTYSFLVSYQLSHGTIYRKHFAEAEELSNKFQIALKRCTLTMIRRSWFWGIFQMV